MKSMLIVQHLQIENANAVSGFTYGFPAISHFLGFTHALSRRLQQAHGLTLGGCAVITHHTQVQSYPLGSREEQVFALSRNPLTKDGKTAPFNEEGRVHLDLSLLLECEFNLDDFPADFTAQQLTEWIATQIPTMRVAGGTVIQLGKVRWTERTDADSFKKLRLQLLPGFALTCRHDVLQQHHQQRLQQAADAELLDSLLDFVTLQSRAMEPPSTGPVPWQFVAKPAAGFWVPLAVGYQAISELYLPGTVASARSAQEPFCWAESVYSLGQWLSPHRASQPEQLLWRYQYQAPLYLCHNQYQTVTVTTEDFEELY